MFTLLTNHGLGGPQQGLIRIHKQQCRAGFHIVQKPCHQVDALRARLRIRRGPSGDGSFARGLRWLDRHSPLRGCSGLAVSASHKIPRRRALPNFQTGSYGPSATCRSRPRPTPSSWASLVRGVSESIPQPDPGIRRVARNMVFWNSGSVKTTLDIPDDLFRAAKAKAAMDGTKLKELVAEGLRLVVHGSGHRAGRRRARLPIVRSSKPGSLNLSGKAIAHAESRLDAGHGR